MEQIIWDQKELSCKPQIKKLCNLICFDKGWAVLFHAHMNWSWLWPCFPPRILTLRFWVWFCLWGGFVFFCGAPNVRKLVPQSQRLDYASIQWSSLSSFESVIRLMLLTSAPQWGAPPGSWGVDSTALATQSMKIGMPLASVRSPTHAEPSLAQCESLAHTHTWTLFWLIVWQGQC